MNKFVQLLRKNWIYFIPIVLLLIFIFSIWDRNYYFGGDLLFPLKPQDSIIKSLYLWEEQNGGLSFFKYMLFFWQGIFYVLSHLQIPIDVIIKIYIATIYILGFIFSYLFYNALFKETKYLSKKLALFFATLFFLNPAAILILIGTWPLYGFPICFYFLIKYLDTKNILYTVPFAFFLNISFFPDLPQAKLLIVFTVAVFFLLIIYSFLRNVRVQSLFIPLTSLISITLVLNAFLLVPFINDAIGDKGVYQYYTSAVTVYNGDADLHSASLPYISRFYNANLVDNDSTLGQFLKNPLFIIWTFISLMLAISSVFLAREKNEKRIIYLSLFVFIVFVFIAKGANPPFGEAYRWALTHIPPAKLFRTTATVIIGGVIFYTILVTISTYYLSKRWKSIFIGLFVINILISHQIYLGYKLDNWLGEDQYQKGISIPSEYFKMGEILDNLKDNGKILIMPFNAGYISKNWRYYGQTLLPWVTEKPLIPNNINITSSVDMLPENAFCAVTSLYNIAYFVREKDTTTTGQEIKKNIEFPGEKIMENQYFQLYKANDSCSVPQVYIPENIIYFYGNGGDITDLSHLPIYKKNSFIYINKDSVDVKKQEESLRQKADHIVIEASSTVDSQMHERSYLFLVLGEDNLIDNIVYPTVSQRPDSLFYSHILWKEEETLKNESLNKRQLLDLKLNIASKRMNEVYRWGVADTSWQTSQKLFKITMEQAIDTAATSEDSRVNLELVYEFIQGYRKKIKEITRYFPFWDKGKIGSWVRIFDNLEEETRRRFIVSDFNNLVYANVTVKPGRYQGYILLNSGKPITDDSASIGIALNDNRIASLSADEIANKSILDLGIINVNSLNNNFAINITNKQNLIDRQNWNAIERMQSVTFDSQGILFSPNQKVTAQGVHSNPVVYQEIKNWEPGATYLLRIQHREQSRSSLHLRINEKQQIYDRNTDTWVVDERNIINEDLQPKPNGDEFKLLVTADKNAVGASLFISGEKGTVRVENVELERIILPRIFLIDSKKNQNNDSAEKPTVDLVKVNPTKYTATINKLQKPFFLVFSETFDQGWKIHRKENNFLSEANHFFVNGYANAWYIDPKVVAKTDSQEFIIEYAPQRLFYIGIIISLISLGGCVLYSMYKFYRRYRSNF